MQQDPTFKEMVRKSFILRKMPDIQIPLIKKQTKFKHELITTLSLSTLIHLLLYPFDTIKTRLIARNQIVDVAKFNQNKTADATVYLGIMRGYGSLMIGNLCHLILGKESLLLAASVEGVLKTWIDMSKISKQMGNQKGQFQIMKKSFLNCAGYGMLRDIIFRYSYVHISTYLHQKYLKQSRFYDQRKRVNNLFIATIIATIISQPFDVCFVKIASQRMIKYTNLLKVPLQIAKQQGYSKLLIGGLWPRLVFNLLSTMILANTYQKFLEGTIQAF